YIIFILRIVKYKSGKTIFHRHNGMYLYLVMANGKVWRMVMAIKNHPFHVNDKGHLMIGDMDAVQLVEQFGTTLYVYDIDRVRDNCRRFTETFQKAEVDARVDYASKAFSSIGILQVVEQEGLNLGVVSSGELYTARQAGFPSNRIHFHGNNKSKEELQLAIEYDIGCII